MASHFDMRLFPVAFIPWRFGNSAQLYNTRAQRPASEAVAGRRASNQSSASFHKGKALGRK